MGLFSRPIARPHAEGGWRVGLTVTGWLLALVVGVLGIAYGEGLEVALAALGAIILGAAWVRRAMLGSRASSPDPARTQARGRPAEPPR